MFDRHTLSFDPVPTGRGDVQQNIHQMIVKEVNLVDIKKSSISTSQQARLKLFSSFGQGSLDVDSAADAVLRRSERQLNNGNRSRCGCLMVRVSASVTQIPRVIWIAVIWTVLDC